MAKKTYRIRNWPEYNRALVKRGGLSLWVDEESLQQWHHPETRPSIGRPLVYSDVAIQCGLLIKAAFHFSLRQAQGCLQSWISLMGAQVKVPHYTTLCRRQKHLKRKLSRVLPRSQEGLHLVIDSTGFKVFGEGEWKVRQHGWQKRRTWRKVHVAVNPETHEIVAQVLTSSSVHDAQALPHLLTQVTDNIAHVAADGAYDAFKVYDLLSARGSQVAIPPRRTAQVTEATQGRAPPPARNATIQAVHALGRERWKQDSGYHRRSLAETTMFRLKTVFGPYLSARKPEHQAVETWLRCEALNRMTALGMPESYAVSS